MINLATGKRWIQQMPISDEEKQRANEKIKSMDLKELPDYLNSLRQKCGRRHYMNKQAKPFWTK